MQLKLTLMSDGWCEQLEHIAISGGKFQNIRFSSMFALIEHPTLGPILFDTGYTQRFFAETERFPARLYRMVTPVQLLASGGAVTQLQARGIRPEAVKHIIISHFHADHVGGLCDFPNAQFHCSQVGFAAVEKLRGWRALRQAFLRGLLPSDFVQRAAFVEDAPVKSLSASYKPFLDGFDLFGDGSVLAIPLPGHATGQIGIIFNAAGGQEYLLAADACWLSRQYRDALMPHGVVRLLVDWSAYRDTLKQLHHLHQNHPSLRILPTHCAEIWNLAP
jgi:glyoxylase-like metal-dependent hydrolase (beta-lactamase superfamily II)